MNQAGTSYESSLLLTLEEISQLVSHSHDPGETLANIVRLIQGRFHTAVCSVYFLEPDSGELVLGATVGLKPESVGRVRMRLDEGLTGLVAEQMAPGHGRRRLPAPAFQVLPRGRRGPVSLVPRRAAGRGRRAAGRAGGADGRAAHLLAQRGAHAGHGGRPARLAGRRRPAAGAGRRRRPRPRRRRRRRPSRPHACTAPALSPGVGVGQAYVVDGFDEWRQTVPLRGDDPAGERRRLAEAMARPATRSPA